MTASPYALGPPRRLVLSDFPADACRALLRRPAETPGHAALLDHVLEDLLVLQRVHRAPETFMLEGKQLIGLDQPPERRLDQLIAILEVIEDLRAEDEEAAIDPQIGILGSAQAVDLAARLHIDEMQAEGRAHREETGDLAACLEGLNHGREIDVGEAVAVIGEEHLLALDMGAHRKQALADVPPQACVDHGDAPVALGIAERLYRVAEA